MDKKIKILFLIHDLSVGGAEKVLVNLVNHMDQTKFDVTVMTLFDVGVNRQFLLPHIHYKSCFRHMVRGNSHLMKFLSPRQLHGWLIRDRYDVEVAYLEGPSARVISGCPLPETRLVSWIHVEQHSRKVAAQSFRSYQESADCYGKFHRIICVSEYVKKDFSSIYPQLKDLRVLYNTNETEQILVQKDETVEDCIFSKEEIKLCGVGKLVPIKGFDKLARIHCRLRKEGYPIHTYVLGVGTDREKIAQYIAGEGEAETFTFLGYQTNPYKYVAKCDLFVCASVAEGFSTAATEALIVGTPVCTVDVSGMKEMLGENNEYGIVTENNEEALYQGIKMLLKNPDLLAHYQKKAEIRGRTFSTDNTVSAVEKMLEEVNA